MSSRYYFEDEFGDVIQKSRQGWGLSEEELAKKTGLTPEQVAQIERYQYSPRDEEIVRLAEVLRLDRDKLQSLLNEPWTSAEPSLALGSLCIQRISTVKSAGNCFLITNSRNDAVIVDPGQPLEDIFRAITDTRCRLTAILVTHGHSDHTASLSGLYERTGAEILAVPSEIADTNLSVNQLGPNLRLLGEIVQVIPVPGHSPGSVAFVFPNAAFVGDVIFARSIGRASHRLFQQHLQSVRHLLTLEKNTVLLPGHGPATTVREELEANPFVGMLGK